MTPPTRPAPRNIGEIAVALHQSYLDHKELGGPVFNQLRPETRQNYLAVARKVKEWIAAAKGLKT